MHKNKNAMDILRNPDGTMLVRKRGSSDSSSDPSADEFPILSRIVVGHKNFEPAEPTLESLETRVKAIKATTELRPEEIDGLADEFSKAFKISAWCALEGDLGPEIETVMSTICNIDRCLAKLVDERKKWLLVLLRRTVANPSNLEALLHLIDADLVKSYLRCCALYILGSIMGSVNSIWAMEMKDGRPFSMSFIRACAKSLADDASSEVSVSHESDDATACFCHDYKCGALVAALQANKSDPLELLETIYSHDWESIFGSEYKLVPLVDDEGFGLIDVYNALFGVALRVLELDHKSATARALLHKLGVCKVLLRRVCRLVCSREVWSKDDGTPNRGEVEELCDFLLNFRNCLVPGPSDPETMALVQQAHTALPWLFRSINFQGRTEMQIRITKSSFIHASKVTGREEWENYILASENQRWELLHDMFLSETSPNEIHKFNYRDFRKGREERLDSKFEMCANCFKTEEEFESSSHTLMRCSRCKELSYCNKQCQVAHWHRAHKKQCRK